MREHKETIVTCVVTLGSTILSEVFPNLATKLVFIALSIVAVIVFFKGDEKDNRGIQRFSFFLAAVLVAFIIVFGVFPEIPSHLLNVGTDQPGEEIEPTSKGIYQTNLNNVNQSLKKLQDDVSQASTVLTELNGFLETEIFLSKEAYPSEVEELLKVLDDKAEVIEKDFPDMASAAKTDVKAKTVELFYKVKLYDKVYHYSSFINAFEKYGIPCSSLGIDEYSLALWDVENLYIFYNMKKELEPDLAENKWYEKKELLFNPHKVELNQYSDFLNYGDWRFTYEGRNAQDVESLVGNNIMNFYMRFHLNFTR